MTKLLKNIYHDFGISDKSLKATFDLYDQFIHFPDLNFTSYETQINDSGKSKTIKKVLIHELRHYIDLTTSNWGISILEEILIVYESRASDKEDKFLLVYNLLDSIKRLYYFDFYTSKGTDNPNLNFFYFETIETIGFRYSNGILDFSKPIFFCRLSNQHKDKIHDVNSQFIRRVPLSTAALLETNALYESFQYSLDSGENSPEMLADDILYNWLLEPSKSVYSVCFHLLTNYNKNNNIRITLRLASILATISLNLNYELVKDLKCPQRVHSGMNSPQYAHVHDAFINQSDRGYFFYCLIRNAFESGVSLVEENMDYILEASNIVSLSKIKEYMKLAEIKNDKIIRFKERFKFILEQREKLISKYDVFSPTAANSFVEDKSNHPLLIFKDTLVSSVNYTDYVWDKNKPLEWLFFVNAIKEKIDEFWECKLNCAI